MVIEAVNIGRLCMAQRPDAEIQTAIMEFAEKYGLLGIMTALPTTPEFMDYEAVYLPKNHFVKDEAMATDDYLALFFPFEKPDVAKNGAQSVWNIDEDRAAIALAIVTSGMPAAVGMSFQMGYAERYDWMSQQFADLAFTLTGSFLYYNDYDVMDKEQRDLYRQGMAAFGGIAPTYRVMLLDRPTVVWDFNSLMQSMQMMFCLMLTDSQRPLRLCRHCFKAFVASRSSAAYCSPQCKNRHNVYKSRAKGEDNA